MSNAAPIRFACPACNAVMSAPADKVGRKVNCPKCGQRLQIPPPLPKTMLGKPLPPPDEPATNIRDWMTQPPPACSEQPATRPPEAEPLDPVNAAKPSRRRPGSLVRLVVLIAATPIVLCMVVCCGGLFMAAAFQPNARCPVCGTRFYVPANVPIQLDDHHYECPGCGRTLSGVEARMLGRGQ